ncbi:MAG: periplasmic protein TonB [Bacteroidetes bacterium]|nr:MAG: periplasmic protein TonB [Bacteroidota bacterium]
MKHVFLLALFIGIYISCQAQTQEKKYSTVYTDKKVDILPSYPGGEYELYQFIQEKFRVNSLMGEAAVGELTMFAVNFIIDSIGNISDIQFYGSDNSYVEKEIRRIILRMPKWEPAITAGSYTSSRIYIPIKYTIDENGFQIQNQSSELFVVQNKKKNYFLKTVLVLGCIIFFVLKFS